MRTKSFLLGGAAAGVLIALAVGASANAETTKHHKKGAAAPSAVEQEVSDLREQVQFLKDRLDEQAAVSRQQISDLKATEAAAQTAQAQAAASAQSAQAAQAQIETIPTQVQTAVAANKPKTDKLYYKGISITMGGFAEAATIYRSHDETADISSSFSKIPFANDKAGHTPETSFTARQSRYSLLAQGDINKDTSAGFYGEFDFQGAAQTANSNQSDSYNPRIRNLYGQVDWNASGWHLLAGQNWSLVTMNSKGITPRNEMTPPQIDAQYIPGFAWARQPQIRLTKDFDNKQLWVAVSVENPQTTFGNVATASGVTITNTQAPTNGYFAATGAPTNYSLNQYPDVVAKVAYEKKFGDHTLHVEALGIGRAFTDRVQITPTATNQAGLLGYAASNSNATTFGGGVGGGVAFDVVPKRLDVQASVLTGSGIGRYGSAGLPDTTARPDGRLQALQETMWLAGGTFHATPKLDLYLFGGEEKENGKVYTSPLLPTSVAFGYGTLPGSTNAGCLVEGGTCSPVTKSIDQITGGFWDKFYQGSFGRLQVGIQYSYTERKTFADALGNAPKANESMVFTSFRYYPF
jgi:hypothetical protein